jgi:hypothetical protein
MSLVQITRARGFSFSPVTRLSTSDQEESWLLKIVITTLISARSIIGHNAEEVTEDSRNLHSEELHKLYSSQILLRFQIREVEIGRACNLIHLAQEKSQLLGSWNYKQQGKS